MILRRFPVLSGILIGFFAALLLFDNLNFWLRVADAQVPFGAFRIMDGTHTQLAGVSHTGRLLVDTEGGGNTAHITSVTHINVSGSGTPGSNLSVRCVNTAGTAFADCGGAGGSGDAVNVFHQSTIRHISSVTHVAGAVSLVGRDGTYVALTGTAVSVAQSTANWNIQHISSAVHLAGGVTDNANSALRVTGVTVFTVMGAIDHVSSQTHLAGMVGDGAGRPPQLTVKQGQPGSIAAWPVIAHQAGQSGNVWRIDHITSVLHVQVAGSGIPNNALSMRCVNTGGTAFESCGGTVTSDTINVFHQSTIRHISSVTHIASAGLAIANQALAVRCVDTGGTTFEACGGAGAAADAVNVFHQSTIRHISSVTHILVAEHQVLRVMGAHVTGTIHVAGLTNVGSGAPGTGTTAIVCHSTLAVHVAAAAPGYTQLIHLTSSNNGIDQSGWRIYICGILLVSAHAQGFSLLEGTGTDCATGKRPVIGAWRPDDAFVVAANGGYSTVAAFPWMSTQNPGNNLCIVQTGRSSTATISGVISYRAGP